MNRHWFVAALCMNAAFLGGCATTVLVQSTWNDNAIVVDGKDRDWGTSLTPLSSHPVALGVRHDSSFLYVCLSTQNRFLQHQILQGGLTVWFDPLGGQEKAFGIRYPLLRRENSPRLNPRESIAENFQLVEPFLREVEIIGPEGDAEVSSLLELKEISVRLGASETGLTYELKLPLRPTTEFRYGISTGPMKDLGIGFETAEPGSDRLQVPSGRAGAGARGGGRRGGGTPTPPADIAGADRPEPLKLWTKTTLSYQ